MSEVTLDTLRIFLEAQEFVGIQEWPEIGPDVISANDPMTKTSICFNARDGLADASAKIDRRRKLFAQKGVAP